ncbi:3-oxoacyl-reductase [Aspergillus karnatakaensis]|uniref:SDR family NAD(P)-dependent oxidoreductase n=1 Tax=Aspergillus karnatakaensis TaxID=1810916 RepID=UPI003CCCF296
MSSLNGKVFTITGAASGMGRAIAHHLANLGASLSITDLSAEGLENTKAELSKNTTGRILARPANICDRAAIDSWIADTASHFGRLDGVINAAGVHPRESGKEPIWKVTDDDWDFAQNVNVKGTLNVVRAALKQMTDAVAVASSKDGQDGSQPRGLGSSIIVFGCNSSVTGAPNLSAYTTSKHAVLGLMRAAAIDAAPFGIRVNAICPGPIDTPMLRNVVSEDRLRALTSAIPLGRLGTTTEILGLVTYLLDENSGFTTGAVHNVDGGLTTI